MAAPKLNKDMMGKGIRSLLQNIDTDLKTTEGKLKPHVVENATGISRIPVTQITVSYTHLTLPTKRIV